MSKVSYPLKCCPWCNKTANFRMECPLNETWLAIINCSNVDCDVRAITRHVPIRKKQRENIQAIREKVERVVKFWNNGNLGFNNEGFEIDFEKIVEDYKTGKLGLPGHRQDERDKA